MSPLHLLLMALSGLTLTAAILHYGYDKPLTDASQIGLLVALCPAVISMAVHGFHAGLPLIIKELHEQSSRRRTFILRVVYALLLYLAAFGFSFEVLDLQNRDTFALLGAGQELFMLFVMLQFIGVYLFMPPMACGLITTEKERDTLNLLFLTRLGTWGILFGKFFSRIVPMFLLMSMSLPLLAFAYSLGGFESSQVWSALWVITATILQVGTLGLACSTWFRTTTGALIATYVLGLTMLFGPPILNSYTECFREFYQFYSELSGGGQLFCFTEWSLDTLMSGPVILFHDGPAAASELSSMFVRTIPLLTVTMFFAGASRFFLVRRSDSPAGNILLRMFRRLDRLFADLNRRAGNITIGRPSSSLPTDRPIAWRETNRKALGTPRYLVRIFIVLEFGTLFVCASSTSSFDGNLEGLSLLLMLLWIVSTLLIAATSTSLISAERSHQTLDTLLTTPLQNREILRQKLKGVRRLMCVLAVPLLTVIAFESFLRWDLPALSHHWRDPDISHWTRAITYTLTALATVFIYFPMISWLCLLIGIKVRSQGKAIVVSLGALAAWCLVPLIVMLPVLAITDLDEYEAAELLGQLSPMMVVPLNEFNEYRDPVIGLIMTVSIYGTITLALRFWCVANLKSLFGRVDSPSGVSASGTQMPARSETPPQTLRGR